MGGEARWNAVLAADLGEISANRSNLFFLVFDGISHTWTSLLLATTFSLWIAFISTVAFDSTIAFRLDDSI